MPDSLHDAAAALRSGDVTSVELTEAAIARADALDANLGVYLVRFDDQALKDAAHADDQFDSGVDVGPLQGIPIAVKDLLAVAEGPTTAQSLVLDPGWAAGKDAVAVERLKRGGTVIMGKLTTMEFACGLPDPQMPFPLPRNPWDVARWPGGSSSGAGAGVAAGLFLAGIGTDTGGSIRIPAAFCGVTGLMPSFGRVPNAGCVPLGYSLDRIGPIARTARDCAAVLTVIAGPDSRDPYSADRPPEDYLADAGRSLEGIRLGVDRRHHRQVLDADPSVEPLFETAVDTLESLGVTVVDVELPYYEETLTAWMITRFSEAFAFHRTHLRERPHELAKSNRSWLPLGACFNGADYVQAQRVRRVVQRAAASLFDRVDAILTPAASVAAPTYSQILQSQPTDVLRGVHTPYWDALGNPALVVPMGFNADTLPLSLQIAGRPFEEALLVRIGAAYQGVTDWHLQMPPLPPSSVGIAGKES